MIWFLIVIIVFQGNQYPTCLPLSGGVSGTNNELFVFSSFYLPNSMSHVTY